LVVFSVYVNETMKELSGKIDQNIVINNVTSCDLHIKKLWQLQCYLHNNTFITSNNERLEFKIWTVNKKTAAFHGSKFKYKNNDRE